MLKIENFTSGELEKLQKFCEWWINIDSITCWDSLRMGITMKIVKEVWYDSYNENKEFINKEIDKIYSKLNLAFHQSERINQNISYFKKLVNLLFK